MPAFRSFLIGVFYVTATLVGGFAPSIDLPTTTTEPTTTTPDPETLPFIVDAQKKESVEALKGTSVILTCQVLRLGDRMVSWMKRVGERLDLVTFGLSTYHSDERYALVFVHPNIWSLNIKAVEEKDRGTYECQISTHPPLTKTIQLHVKVPQMEIREANGMVIREKFYEVGSSIDLQCVASNVPYEVELGWFKRNVSLSHLMLAEDLSSNATSHLQPAFSDASKRRLWLHIESATSDDTGNYSCQAHNMASARVKLHVLDGEDSVAMQHSTNASWTTFPPWVRSFLNLLLLISLLCGNDVR